MCEVCGGEGVCMMCVGVGREGEVGRGRLLEACINAGRHFFSHRLSHVCATPLNVCVLYARSPLQVAAAVACGDACFGTIDSWLIYCLTGGANGGVHVTDGKLSVLITYGGGGGRWFVLGGVGGRVDWL